MTGNGHSIISSIHQYGVDEEDKRKIINALCDGKTDNIKTLVDKTLEGKDTPDNLSIIPYTEENNTLLRNQILEAFREGKTIIAGKQEEIDKIINSL